MVNSSNLNLYFHPDNKYNKPCIGDRDANPGLLIKINSKSASDNENKIDFEVVGVTTVNYKFNREFYFFNLSKNVFSFFLGLCDFQFLPIISEKNDCEADGEMIYDKICPKQLPSLEWFV